MFRLVSNHLKIIIKPQKILYETILKVQFQKNKKRCVKNIYLHETEWEIIIYSSYNPN